MDAATFDERPDESDRPGRAAADAAPTQLRIVHAAPSLNRGGGERLMIELANHQAGRGHHVTVLLGFPLPPHRAHQGLDPRIDVRVIGRKMDSRRGMYRALLPWFWRNRHWLAEQDLVHCHMSFAAVLGSLVQLHALATRRRRPAIVETDHAVGMKMPRVSRWLHARMLARRDALAFMVDHEYRHALLARRPGLATRIIPAGIPLEPSPRRDPALRAEGRRSLGIPESGELVVGTVGRFFAERQPAIFPPIFARIAEALGPGVHFVMAGDGPELERVVAQAAELGLEGRVHFPGLVTDLPGTFAAMDLYLTLNVGPVPGVAGLQAIAAGLPALAYQVVASFADEEAQPFWSSRNPARIADKAVGLLRSPAALAALASRQRAHLVSHHSAEAMLSAYDELYAAALEHSSRR